MSQPVQPPQPPQQPPYKNCVPSCIANYPNLQAAQLAKCESDCLSFPCAIKCNNLFPNQNPYSCIDNCIDQFYEPVKMEKRSMK